MNEISKIKVEIDEIKEYIENYLCQQCAEMQQKLQALEAKLDSIQNIV